jgi:hypothetical protein
MQFRSFILRSTPARANFKQNLPETDVGVNLAFIYQIVGGYLLFILTFVLMDGSLAITRKIIPLSDDCIILLFEGFYKR